MRKEGALEFKFDRGGMLSESKPRKRRQMLRKKDMREKEREQGLDLMEPAADMGFGGMTRGHME